MVDQHPGHRRKWVSPETANSRYPERLPDKVAREARKLIASGRMTHEEAAAYFGYELHVLTAGTEPKRGKGEGHGNGVMNVKPEDLDAFRDQHCLPGEAIHRAFTRLLEEHGNLRAWAQATGYRPFDAPSPEQTMGES